ncbi:YggN family protein [Photobacterium japonica]|uniref:YggN family protein n=1 Tax=Photobacterium japonica TaxID=2910235 RepID=UPI003D14AFEB
MMKKLGLALLLLPASLNVQAQSCPVNVPNDIHINDKQVALYQQGTAKVVIDENNQLFINGEKMDLDAAQKKAVEAYREHVQAYLPKMAELADDGVAVANDVVTELAASLGGEEAFAGTHALINQYSEQAKAKFYPEGQFVLPADIFSTVESDWRQEFEQAMKHVSAESMAAMFAALTAEMKDGELNFTEFQQKMLDLKTRMQTTITERSKVVAKQADEVCGDVKALAEEEQKLQTLIPELKNYPMFKI